MLNIKNFFVRIGLSLRDKIFEKKYIDLERRYQALHDDYNILLSLYVKLLEEYVETAAKSASKNRLKK